MSTATGLEFKIQEMAQRIRTLREIVGYTPADMALKTGVSESEYLSCEAGEKDLNFAFLYRCALALNVDVTDIIEGTSPRLAGYTVTRKGQGQEIQKAAAVPVDRAWSRGPMISFRMAYCICPVQWPV